MAIEHQEAQKHPTYWFEDGSITLRVQNHLFRVHRSLICRHSRVLLGVAAAAPDVVYILEHGVLDSQNTQVLQGSLDKDEKEEEKCSARLDGRIKTSEPVLSKDFEELLRHLYHDEYVTICRQLEPSTQAGTLSPQDLTLLRTLLGKLIAHFTPILFTPSTSSSHMECTETFADHWMPLVILPSLVESDSDEGGSGELDEKRTRTARTIISVYKPLESLETIKSINWQEKGLCQECVKEKKEEWSDEQKVVWEKFGEWVEEASG
ncbi:hypothetical protein H1R20_g13341, partial [Candolleomyces eurysporus]